MIGPTFELRSVERDSHLALIVRGEIDIKTAPELESKLSDEAAASGLVVVDVSDVGFIDSIGLRVLATARARLEGDGGQLVVCAPPDSAVLRTMRLAGLIDDFQVITDPRELSGAE